MVLFLCLSVADLQTLLTVYYYYTNTQYDFFINTLKRNPTLKNWLYEFFFTEIKHFDCEKLLGSYNTETIL